MGVVAAAAAATAAPPVVDDGVGGGGSFQFKSMLGEHRKKYRVNIILGKFQEEGSD